MGFYKGHKMAIPSIPVHSPAFQYRNAAQTDVTITWRAHGWKPTGTQPAERMRVGSSGITWRDNEGNVTMHLAADGTFASDYSRPNNWHGVVSKVEFRSEINKPDQVAIAPDGTRVEFREAMRFGPPAAGSGFNLFGG